MFKNLIQLYSIAICFLSSTILMALLLFSGNNLSYVVFPEYMNKIVLSSFDSDEEYLERQAKENNQKYERLIKMLPNELSKKRLKDRENYIKNSKTLALQSLITQIYDVLIALVFFIIHWRLYKRSS